MGAICSKKTSKYITLLNCKYGMHPVKVINIVRSATLHGSANSFPGSRNLWLYFWCNKLSMQHSECHMDIEVLEGKVTLTSSHGTSWVERRATTYYAHRNLEIKHLHKVIIDYHLFYECIDVHKNRFIHINHNQTVNLYTQCAQCMIM